MQEHGAGRGVRVVSASGGAPFLYHYLLSGHIKTKHYDFSARSTTHLKIWSSAERPISGGCSAASGQYKVLWLVWGADQRASESQSRGEGARRPQARGDRREPGGKKGLRATPDAAAPEPLRREGLEEASGS